jgi:hypothetical protein
VVTGKRALNIAALNDWQLFSYAIFYVSSAQVTRLPPTSSFSLGKPLTAPAFSKGSAALMCSNKYSADYSYSFSIFCWSPASERSFHFCYL